MQFNQKLIKQLAAGEIAIRTTPETMHTAREILKEAFPEDAYLDQGNIKSNWTYRAACHDNTFCVDGNPDGLKEVLAKNFLLPEPKFKVGDVVIWGCEEKLITESKYDEHCKTWFHRFKENGSVWHSENHMRPQPKFKVGQKVLVRGKSDQTITEIRWCDCFQSGKGGWSYIIGALNGIGYGESLLESVPIPAATPKFKVGDRVIHKESTGNNSFIVHHISWCADLKDFCCYPANGIGLAEFALVHAPDPVQDPVFDDSQYIIGKPYEFGFAGCWFKGVLLAIYKDKYVADIDGQVSYYKAEDIRHIPQTPVKIERWAMYNPKNDTFFGKPRNTRNEAKASYKHAPLGYSPIKLEGTYYVDPDQSAVSWQLGGI